MTKPEFYLAPDGSLQPLPESGPLTLTDGALTYPGREEPAPEPVAEEPDIMARCPWPDGTLLRITNARKMWVHADEYRMVDGDVVVVSYAETRNPSEPAAGWPSELWPARVVNPRTGTTAWVCLGCVEVVEPDPFADLLASTDALLARVNAVSATDVSTWPQMQVGETVEAPVERSRAIMPRVGHANARHAPMRWRGYTKGGSFVVERVA